jgi:hypothetical protein
MKEAAEYIREGTKRLFVSSANELLSLGKILPDAIDYNSVVFVKD